MALFGTLRHCRSANGYVSSGVKGKNETGVRMNAIIQDIRFALRMMAKNLGFTVVALFVLAMGIGSNSALFSVVNSVLLEPLPYRESDRLVQIGREYTIGRSDALSISQFLYWSENNSVFDGIGLYDGRGGGTNLVEGDRPERIASIRVSPSFFSVLSASPQLGRSFNESDSIEGAEKVAIVSDNLWRRRFDADPTIIGRVLRLSGNNRTVVGVMPAGFDFNTHADIWMPLTLTFDSKDRGAVYYSIARLKGDITFEAAQADMGRVAKQLSEEHPDIMAAGEKAFVLPYLEQVVGRVRPALLMLCGAVGIVLLIACANVGNLLLARATHRQREMAVRAALGAGRGRMIRQLLTESALLAFFGAGLGLLVAQWAMRLLVRIRPSNLPRLDAIDIDGSVVAFTILAGLVAVLMFGMFPAMKASNADLHGALKEGSQRSGAGKRGGRIRSMLVVGEISLALVLLVGATLLIESFRRVTNLDPGFDANHILTMKMSLGGTEDLTTARFMDLSRRVREKLETVPGIESAATVSTLPLEHGFMTIFDIGGRPSPDPARRVGRGQWRQISAKYFESMGIPIHSGRTFSEHDTIDSEPVVIINQALARKYFPEEDPIGQGLVTSELNSDTPPDRIVGVVGDILELQLDRPPTPTVFSFVGQGSDEGTAFTANVFPTCWVLKTKEDPLSYGAVVQRAVLAVDRENPVSSVRSMEDVMAVTNARRQFSTVLMGVFAIQAIVLAAVGIYGVMSYSVAQRTKEIGIRMALGSSRSGTLKLVVGQGARLALIGVVIGLAGAFGLTRLMARMLFEVSATNPTTFLVGAIGLFLVAGFACLIPATRATRVNPIIALRDE